MKEKEFKEIIINGEVIGYKMINNTSVPYIDYNDFKKNYKKNMEYNFKKLNSRVIDSLYNSDLEKIKELSKIAPVLQSANFSLGVILLNRLVKEISPILRDSFDIEIVEAHHHNKVDSPSGTAKMLLNSALGENNYPKYGREGYSLRDPKEIGVHSIRGGSIVGEHEVLYCGEDEVLSLKHTAQSKKIFAVGAIKAAEWIIDKDYGLYDMEDVLFGN